MRKFSISELDFKLGTLAISPIPGRSGVYSNDLDKILRWGPTHLLSTVERFEFGKVGAESFKSDVVANQIEFLEYPLPDFGAPPRQSPEWDLISDALRVCGESKLRLLIHCFGGCGRSGSTALRLLVETGENPEQALSRLRQVRSCAVETDAQMLWATKGAISRK